MDFLFPRVNNMKYYKFAKYDILDDEIIKKGLDILSNFQKEILLECLEKGSGALSLPMGSGKTIISIILGLILSKNNGKILVVVQKNLITNYAIEIEKFFGNLIEYDILHKEYIKNIDYWTCNKKITITTTNVLSPEYKKLDLKVKYIKSTFNNQYTNLVKYKKVRKPLINGNYKGVRSIYSTHWDCLIIDECQEYYNHNCDKSGCLCCVSCKNKWLLSGTVIQEPNKLFGYYLLLNKDGIPRSQPEFIEYIKKKEYKGYGDTLVKRDTNEDFVKPIINKKIISHSLTPEETKIYANVKNIIRDLQNKHYKNKIDKRKDETKKFSSYILSMINYLRQCIICPILPIATVTIAMSNEDTRNELSEIFMGSINRLELGNWLNNLESIKSSRLRNILENLEQDKNEKVIIFSCHRVFLNVLKSYIIDRDTFTVSGDMNIETRKRVLNNFEKSSNGVILLTYDIGGSGCNLQHCSTVYFSDYWWNVGKTNQAIGRILRTGQKSNIVNIKYFTSNTGIENGIFKLQKQKKVAVEELMFGVSNMEKIKLSMQEILKLLNNEDNINILREIQNIN